MPGARIPDSAQVAALRRQFQQRWFNALAKFTRASALISAGVDPATGGTLAPAAREVAAAAAIAALGDEWDATIERGWSDAYKGGIVARGVAPPAALPSHIADEIARQQRFARAFAQEVAGNVPGSPGRMNIGPRSNLYANTVSGAFSAGTADAGRPGERIWWNLGPAEHCPDCPVLAANSPYSATGEGGLPRLPTTPRAGATICRSNCKCYLSFAPPEVAPPGGPPPRPPPAPGRPFVSGALENPTPPPGKRPPTPQEESVLADLEARVNHARRMMEQTKGTPEQARWIRERREAATALRETAERLGVHRPPRFDVGEVVSGRKVPGAEIDHLTGVRGLDGRTITRAGAAEARAALDRVRDDLAARVAALPETVTDLDLKDLLIRAGAPPELLDGAQAARLVVNGIGRGTRATFAGFLALLAAMIESPYDVEVGPLDGDRWQDLLSVGGVWIRGPASEVRRAMTAASGLAWAPWSPG